MFWGYAVTELVEALPGKFGGLNPLWGHTEFSST